MVEGNHSNIYIRVPLSNWVLAKLIHETDITLVYIWAHTSTEAQLHIGPVSSLTHTHTHIHIFAGAVRICERQFTCMHIAHAPHTCDAKAE